MYVLPYGQMSLWGLSLKPQMWNFYCGFFIFIFLFIFIINTVSASETIGYKASRLKGIYRIGPHNKDILSIIFGSLLGDAHGEKRLNGVATRFYFSQEDSHVEYLLYLHKFMSEAGYCNPKTPVLLQRLGSKGKLRKVVRFTSWTYTSFNWIYNIWYKDGLKHVPDCIGEYLTPLALAIWIMDDGSKRGNDFKFCTHSFIYNDCLKLVVVLNDNFNIKASVQSAGSKDQYVIYVWKESMNNLRAIVSPYIIPEMKYKIV